MTQDEYMALLAELKHLKQRKELYPSWKLNFSTKMIIRRRRAYTFAVIQLLDKYRLPHESIWQEIDDIWDSNCKWSFSRKLLADHIGKESKPLVEGKSEDFISRYKQCLMRVFLAPDEIDVDHYIFKYHSHKYPLNKRLIKHMLDFRLELKEYTEKEMRQVLEWSLCGGIKPEDLTPIQEGFREGKRLSHFHALVEEHIEEYLKQYVD